MVFRSRAEKSALAAGSHSGYELEVMEMPPEPPQVPPPGNPEPPLLPPGPANEERTWALAAHLSAFSGHFIPFGHIIGPLIIWLVKRDSSEFVADQAKESLNAQISVTIYMAFALLLVFVLIGFPMLFVLWLADVILVIVAAVSANDGKRYRYPFILRLVK